MKPGTFSFRTFVVCLAATLGMMLPCAAIADDKAVVSGEIGSSVGFPSVAIDGTVGPNALVMLLDVPDEIVLENARKLGPNRWSFPVRSAGDVKMTLGAGVRSGATFKAMIFRDDTGELTERSIVVKVSKKPAAKEVASKKPASNTTGGTATEIALPVDTQSPDIVSSENIMLLNVPEGVTVKAADKIGDGLWLIDRKNIAEAKIVGNGTQNGVSKMKLFAVGAGGTVNSKSRLVVDFTRGDAQIAPLSGAVATTAANQTEAKPVAVAETAAPAAPAAESAAAGGETTAAPAVEAKPAESAPAEPAISGAGDQVVDWRSLIEKQKRGGASSGGTAAGGQAARAPKPAADQKSEEELIVMGRFLVKECTTCHNVYAKDVGIPVMAGLTVERFMDTMDLYRRGKRSNKVMESISNSLSETETRALAVYLGKIKPGEAGSDQPAGAPKKEPEEDLLAMAKVLVRECTTCHNLYGNDIGIPVMIGLSVDRFEDTMDLYRRKKRSNKVMQSVAESLSEKETRALALYLSRIKPADKATIEAQALTPPSGGAPVQVKPAAVKRRANVKDAARIAAWVERGQSMIDEGNVASGRLLLKRAAEYGDPRGALALGGSYDPNTMKWVADSGIAAEPLIARKWYLEAKALGAGPEVDRRLANLPP